MSTAGSKSERIRRRLLTGPPALDREIAVECGTSEALVTKVRRYMGIAPTVRAHTPLRMDITDRVCAVVDAHPDASVTELAEMLGMSKGNLHHHLKSAGLERPRRRRHPKPNQSRAPALPRPRVVITHDPDAPRFLRLLQLLSVIRCDPAIWPRRALADAFGISERMMDKDLQLLRSMGFVISHTRTGYVIESGPAIVQWLSDTA